ncbi:hypothetical protein HZC35_01950 [Candidatus Saganbacteria bacterium]|nr:hypothetical protein [Candidatus Saganbacteria bacterium]
MKKLFIIGLGILLLASVSQAQLLIGSRAAGMGGAGSAVVTDLAAAYYNPAGLMKNQARAAELKVALGASYSNPDKLVAAISAATDPAKFMQDNYANDLSFTGSLNGVIGLNVRKIGISVIPMMSALVDKRANTMAGTAAGIGNAAGALTLGHSFGVPYVGTLHLGVNGKYIYAANGAITTNAGGGTQTWSVGNGIGFDIGALTTVNVPLVTEINLALVARDLNESVTYKNKSQTATTDPADPTKFIMGPTVDGADTTVAGTSSYVLGAAATIPVVGILTAIDLENVSTAGNPTSNTHIGIEWPIFMNMLVLRAGTASGPNLQLTTFGAKLGLPILGLDVAMVQDGKNTKNSSYVVDINIGI